MMKSNTRPRRRPIPIMTKVRDFTAVISACGAILGLVSVIFGHG